MLAALADELELSEAERKVLVKKIEVVREDYYKQVAELKADSHKDILKALPPAKRKQVEKLLGDSFDSTQHRRDEMNERRKKIAADRKAIEERMEALKAKKSEISKQE